MTLAEFLGARLAEDEAMAQSAALTDPPPWSIESTDDTTDTPIRDRNGDWLCLSPDGGVRGGHERAAAGHIARWDPSRVLAEVAAKREIVRLFVEAAVLVSRSHEDSDIHLAIHLTAEAACQCLAAVYSGHPDYDEAWRP